MDTKSGRFYDATQAQKLIDCGERKRGDFISFHIGKVVRIKKHAFKVTNVNTKTGEVTLRSCSYSDDIPTEDIEKLDDIIEKLKDS